MSEPRQRIPYGKEQRFQRHFTTAPPGPLPTCHDCGVVLGELHKDGCDMEECETCGGQRIGCSCCVVCRAHEKDGTWCVCGTCIERIEAGRVAAGAGDPEGTLGDRPPAPSDATIGGNVSDTMTPVAKDDPRWLAWQQYVRTPDFGNTRSWPMKGPSYIDGALWAAFIVGWEAAVRAVRPTPRAALTVERLAELLTEYYGVEHGEGNATQAAEWLLPRLVVPPTGSVTDMCPECGGLTTHVGKCSRWRAASPAAAPPQEEK